MAQWGPVSVVNWSILPYLLTRLFLFGWLHLVSVVNGNRWAAARFGLGHDHRLLHQPSPSHIYRSSTCHLCVTSLETHLSIQIFARHRQSPLVPLYIRRCIPPSCTPAHSRQPANMAKKKNKKNKNNQGQPASNPNPPDNKGPKPTHPLSSAEEGLAQDVEVRVRVCTASSIQVSNIRSGNP